MYLNRTFGLIEPESIEEDENGNLYTALHDGKIVRIAPSSEGIVGSGKISIVTDVNLSEMAKYFGARRGRPYGTICSQFFHFCFSKQDK